MSGWLTPKGAAAHAAVSETTVLRAARRGVLVGYKVNAGKCWRFRPEDVDAWVQRLATLATPVLVRRGA